jgi:hypothetical protein
MKSYQANMFSPDSPSRTPAGQDVIAHLWRNLEDIMRYGKGGGLLDFAKWRIIVTYRSFFLLLCGVTSVYNRKTGGT